jgi:hypothetical protein
MTQAPMLGGRPRRDPETLMTSYPTPSILESLEARRLMSVSMQPNGVVVVQGTDGDDNVQIFANAIGSQPVLTI